MRSPRSLISVLQSLVLSIPALPAVALSQGFPPAPSPAAGMSVEVVADGLHDPRGLAFGPGNVLHVAEAGTTVGVFVPPPPPAPVEPPTRTRCEVYWPVGPKTPGFDGRQSADRRRSRSVARDFWGHVYLLLEQRSERLAVSEPYHHLFRQM